MRLMTIQKAYRMTHCRKEKLLFQDIGGRQLDGRFDGGKLSTEPGERDKKIALSDEKLQDFFVDEFVRYAKLDTPRVFRSNTRKVLANQCVSTDSEGWSGSTHCRGESDRPDLKNGHGWPFFKGFPMSRPQRPRSVGNPG